MTVFTAIGITLIVLLGMMLTSFIIGFFITGGPDTSGDSTPFVIGAAVTIVLFTFGVSFIYAEFLSCPEKFGYTKVEAETVNVRVFTEHPNSEVVVDD